MIRNNIKFIIYHFFIRILYFFSMFFIGFNSSLPSSEQEHLSRAQLSNFKSWTIFFIIIILYFVFGLFLRNYENKLKNFLSVSAISFIGLLLMSVGVLPIERIINFNYYLLFSFDIPPIGVTKKIYDVRTLIFSIVFALIPSLTTWIGIEVKRKINSIIKF